MKKIFYFIFCLLLHVSLQAQILDPGGGIQLGKLHTYNFSLAEMQFDTIDGYTQVSFDDCSFVSEAGHPKLPYLTVRYIIPYDKKVSGINVERIRTQTIQGNYLLYPAQPDYPISQPRPDFVPPDSLIYSSNSPYIGGLVVLADQYYDKGYHIACLHIYPLSYTPATGSLQLYTGISFRLDYTNQNETPPLPQSQSQLMHELVKSSIAKQIRNGEDIETMGGGAQNILANTESFSMSNLRGMPVIASSNGMRPEYLIITDDTDKDGILLEPYEGKSMTDIFQQLADWKTKKGIPTAIVKISDIKQHYLGCDLQEKIHNFLADVYSKWGTLFVLFGGDINIVPERIVPLIDHSSYYCPSDLYYTAIETSWDSNGNGIFGEKNDALDKTSEFYYGRASVENTQEAQIFVSKVIAYETFENVPISNRKYVNNILAISAQLDTGLSSGMTSEVEKLFTGSQSISQGNINKWRVYDPYNGTSPIDSTLSLSRETALQCLDRSIPISTTNERSHLVYHIDHSSYLSMGTSSKYLKEVMSRSHVEALTNAPYYSIVYTNGCSPGEFHKDCIAERFLNNPQGGAVAMVASSTTSWASELSWFKKFCKELYVIKNGTGNYTSPSTYNIGIVHDVSLPITYYTDYKRKNHLFGDPEMPVRTMEPKVLSVTHPNIASNVNNELTITISNMTNRGPVMVCLMKDADVYLRQQYTGEAVSHTFNFIIEPETPGNLYLTVSGQNYIPYEAVIPVSITGGNLYITEFGILDQAGNGNSIMDSGETINLSFSLKNNGNVNLQNVSARLECNFLDNEIKHDVITYEITLIDSIANYGTINSGSVVTRNNFQIKLSEHIPDGTAVECLLHITNGSGNYTVIRKLITEVKAPEVKHILNYYVSTINQTSENIKLYVELINIGSGQAKEITATLSTTSSNVSFSNSVVQYGDFLAFENKINEGSGEEIAFSVTPLYNNEVFTLNISNVYGKTWTDHFTITRTQNSITGLYYTPEQHAITLNWDTVSNIKGYLVYRSLLADGTYERMTPYPIASTIYTDNGLEAKTLY